jgi:diguanylate cyclase (GGDEF)-like protein
MDGARYHSRIGLGFFLLPVVLVAVLAMFPDTPGHRALFDVIPVVVALAAAGTCAYAGLKSANRLMRRFWSLYGAAVLCSAVAELIWAFDELILGSEHPSPTSAFAAWLIAYPLSFAALVMLSTRRRDNGLAETSFSLDSLLFCMAGVALAWEFLMSPALAQGAGQLTVGASVAYPIGDLLLVSALASLALAPTRRTLPRGVGWIVASVLVMLVADVVYVRLNVTASYSTGSWLDPLWPLSYALSGMAALTYLGSRRDRADCEPEPAAGVSVPETGFRVVLRRLSSYAAVIVAGVVSYDHFIVRSHSTPFSDTVVVVLSALIPLIVLVRQHLVSVQIHHLQSSLVGASQGLEHRVHERTAELAAEKERLNLLNQATRDISRCVSVQEVLSAGAALLTQAKHCAYVAISAPGSRGELQFGCATGVPSSRQTHMRRTLRKFVLSNAARSDSTPLFVDGPIPAMIFPVVYRQMMLGAACMTSVDTSCEMSEAESELIQNIVSQLGVALDGVCRYDDARFLADNDALTGLANRRAVTERLELELVRSQRSGTQFALLMMDVDKFKFFNDTHGHSVGDQVLVATASALAEAVRAGDLVGRFGGDEFVAILPDTDLSGAAYVCGRIAKCLDKHAVLVKGGPALSLHVSCGVAVYPEDGRAPDELFRAADARMYESKRRSQREAPLVHSAVATTSRTPNAG